MLFGRVGGLLLLLAGVPGQFYIYASCEGNVRRLGKKHHGHGNEELIPIRQNSTYITDPAAFSHGLPPMAPFPEETMVIDSYQEPLYDHHDIPKGWGPMEADLPWAVEAPMPSKQAPMPSKQMAPPVKGTDLPPILLAPPAKAPPVQPLVVNKYMTPPPVEEKKGKKHGGHGGHGGKKHGDHGGKKHGDHGGKKHGGKKHGEGEPPAPIVIVLPEKHARDSIPPPMKEKPMYHDHHDHHGGHGGYDHHQGDFHGDGQGHGHGHGHGHYEIPPYAPMRHEAELMGPPAQHGPGHDWIPVSAGYADGHAHGHGKGFHDSGYRVVSKAADPWV